MTHKKTVRLMQEFSLRKFAPRRHREVLHTTSRRGYRRDYVGSDALPYDSSDGAGGYQSYETSGMQWSDIVGGTLSDTINKETNELFWSKTNYKVGQKLDPKIPADKEQMPVWMAYYNTVKLGYGIKPGQKIPDQYTGQTPIAPKPVVTASVPTPTPISPAQIGSFKAQAESLKGTAKAQESEAARLATAAIELAKIAATETQDAAKIENLKKEAESLKVQSNNALEQSKISTLKASSNEQIVKMLSEVKSISGLAYLASKSWASTPGHSQYFGWMIRKNGGVETIWTDITPEINDWFGSMGVGEKADTVFAIYWDEKKRDASGAYLPVDTFSMGGLTQEMADAAFKAAIAREMTPNAPETGPVKPAGSGGAGAAIAVVAVGSLFAFAAAKGKR